MVVAAVKAREAEDAVEVRQALELFAGAVSVGPESTGWLANVSFLVARDSAERFLHRDGAAPQGPPVPRRAGPRPLPPYSFVEPGPAEPAGTPRVGVEARGGAEPRMGLISEVLLLPFAPCAAAPG